MGDNIAKKLSKSLVIPTEKTTDHMALNFFPDTILLLHIYNFEGYLSRYKIDKMVTHNHSNSCK